MTATPGTGSPDDFPAAQFLVLPDSGDTRLFIELSHFAGADLSPAAIALELALARLDADDSDQSAGFLIDSAVMSYCRAFFASRVRRPLSAYLEVPERFQSVDQRIREYRNMMIAHSQSSLTITLPVVIERSDGSRLAQGWTLSQPLPRPLLGQFAELVDVLAARLDELIAEVVARLDSQLADAVPLEDSPFVFDHALAESFTARSSRHPYPAASTLYWTHGVTVVASPEAS